LGNRRRGSELRAATGVVTLRGSFRFPGPARQSPGCADGPPSHHRAFQNDHTPSGWNLWPAMVFRSYGSAAVVGAYGFSRKTTTKLEKLGPKEGVDSVHTFRLGVPRTVIGLLRIPHVFARSQCFQGRECSSSPTLGTVFSQVKGLLDDCVCTKTPKVCTRAYLFLWPASLPAPRRTVPSPTWCGGGIRKAGPTKGSP
jgi:hypothetical protein